jgi:hypothetical protein
VGTTWQVEQGIGGYPGSALGAVWSAWRSADTSMIRGEHVFLSGRGSSPLPWQLVQLAGPGSLSWQEVHAVAPPRAAGFAWHALQLPGSCGSKSCAYRLLESAVAWNAPPTFGAAQPFSCARDEPYSSAESITQPRIRSRSAVLV